MDSPQTVKKVRHNLTFRPLTKHVSGLFFSKNEEKCLKIRYNGEAKRKIQREGEKKCCAAEGKSNREWNW